MTDSVTAETATPDFGARKLLFVGTGSVGVMFMPMWANWLRATYPEVDVRYVLTRSAERFVTQAALSAHAGSDVLQDVWSDDPRAGTHHVELSQWADAIVVHPASFHFVSRFAVGIADTPVLLALQCTRAPIAIAPALPPGGIKSYAYARHLEALGERDNVVVLPPQPGFSLTTGRMDASVAMPLPEVIAAVERLRQQLQRDVAAEENEANTRGGTE
ncbi:flavoprotein [Streptomyces alfalfae]